MKFYITKGPWQAHEIDVGWYLGHGDCNGTNYVADVHKWIAGDDLDKQARANKQAIEAVPDMIEALKEIIEWEEWGNKNGFVISIAKEALKKAGGKE